MSGLIKPMRIPKKYSKDLAKRTFKSSDLKDNNLYLIHQIDDLERSAYFKYITVMRILKKSFGDIIYDMKSERGRYLNRILSAWRRKALEQLQNGLKFGDLIKLSPVYLNTVNARL